MVKTREDLIACLAGMGFAVETRVHAPVFTVSEARALRGEIAGLHTKNLFLRDKKSALFLVVAPEDAEIDLKHLHRRIGASGRLSFGRPEALVEVLGVQPGSVTAFAALNDRAGLVTVVLDAAIPGAPRVNAHPMENTATTSISGPDLVAFLRATGHVPRIVDLSGRN